MRVPPKEVLEQAQLIPKDKDSIVYCTCVSEKTSRMILENALKLQFTRIKFLKGDWQLGRRKAILWIDTISPFIWTRQFRKTQESAGCDFFFHAPTMAPMSMRSKRA